MQIGLIAHELPRTYFAEGDAGAVVRVDIGCYLEDKASELRLRGNHFALFGLGRFGAGGYLYEAVEQLLHTEVVKSRAEEYGRHLGRAVRFFLELRVNAVYKLKVFAQSLCKVAAHMRI